MVASEQEETGPLSERGRNWLDLPTFPVDASVEVKAETLEDAKQTVMLAFADQRIGADMGFAVRGRVGAVDVFVGLIDYGEEYGARDDADGSWLGIILMMVGLSLAVAFGYWVGQ